MVWLAVPACPYHHPFTLLCRCKFNVKVLEMAPFRFRARMPGQRLRIGYMSSDFGNHPLSHLMQVRCSVARLHPAPPPPFFVSRSYALLRPPPLPQVVALEAAG